MASMGRARRATRSSDVEREGRFERGGIERTPRNLSRTDLVRVKREDSAIVGWIKISHISVSQPLNTCDADDSKNDGGAPSRGAP